MAGNLPRARYFQDLLVWQKAHRFVLGVYKLTATFPKNETYGLASQMRRAAVSIPSNIAEGFKRRGVADKLRFLNIAEASISECSYYLMLSRDLGYGRTEDLAQLLDDIGRLATAYGRAIRWAPSNIERIRP